MVAPAAAVASAIVAVIEKSLGSKGEATPETVSGVLALVNELGAALRSA